MSANGIAFESCHSVQLEDSLYNRLVTSKPWNTDKERYDARKTCTSGLFAYMMRQEGIWQNAAASSSDACIWRKCRLDRKGE